MVSEIGQDIFEKNEMIRRVLGLGFFEEIREGVNPVTFSFNETRTILEMREEIGRMVGLGAVGTGVRGSFSLEEGFHKLIELLDITIVLSQRRLASSAAVSAHNSLGIVIVLLR